MRKTLALVLSLVMVLSLVVVGVSAADVKEIATAEEFAAMELDGNYKLVADITLTADQKSVGPKDTPFTGTFDGNGHSITITTRAAFREVTGTIKNLTVKGELNDADSGYTAPLVMLTKGGTFENITNECKVNNTFTFTENVRVAVGGIVGYVGSKAATFVNCVNKADITGPEATGGILGEAQVTDTSFTNCVNYGKITMKVAISGSAAGGIVGYSGTGNVNYTNCVNYGEIDTNYRAGGITGDARKGATCVNCVNNGKVTGNSAAGGIIGYDGDSGTSTPTKLTSCVNNGEITDKSQAGGLIGYLYGSGSKACAIIDGCINNGKVNGGKYISEFLGYSNSWGNTIKNSIGVGELTATAVENFPARFCIMGCSSTQPASMVMENVYIADGGKTEWLSWAAFNDTESNASHRIPLSACLGKDLKDVEFEYPVYADKNYSAIKENVKIKADDEISAKDGETVLGIRVKAITRIELNEENLAKFAAASGVKVHLENGKVAFGEGAAPATGDAMIWVAVVALVSVLGMGVAVKARNN